MYGSYYSKDKDRGYQPSEIVYYMNPDTPLDKIFDNIQYRLDVFKEDIYQPDDTFKTFEIENEYQDASIDFIITNRGLNIRKKFRA
jgi:hypothetical protein